jgi:hypothetical protein
MSNRKECRQLKEELEARSVCSLLSNETLFRTQHELQWLFRIERELQRKEVELVQAKVQIMELQGLLKERKGRKEGSTTTTASYFLLPYIKKVSVTLDCVLAAVVTLLLVHVACYFLTVDL